MPQCPGGVQEVDVDPERWPTAYGNPVGQEGTACPQSRRQMQTERPWSPDVQQAHHWKPRTQMAWSTWLPCTSINKYNVDTLSKECATLYLHVPRESDGGV